MSSNTQTRNNKFTSSWLIPLTMEDSFKAAATTNDIQHKLQVDKWFTAKLERSMKLICSNTEASQQN